VLCGWADGLSYSYPLRASVSPYVRSRLSDALLEQVQGMIYDVDFAGLALHEPRVPLLPGRRRPSSPYICGVHIRMPPVFVGCNAASPVLWVHVCGGTLGRRQKNRFGRGECNLDVAGRFEDDLWAPDSASGSDDVHPAVQISDGVVGSVPVTLSLVLVRTSVPGERNPPLAQRRAASDLLSW